LTDKKNLNFYENVKSLIIILDREKMVKDLDSITCIDD